MFNVIIFGPPGSGKGTQSSRIVEKYRLKHISTGDLLRNEIAGGTELGKEAKKIMDVGGLVSDEIILGMIQNVLNTHTGIRGFLFDGFPRTTAQAEGLDNLLRKQNATIGVVLAMKVSEEELVKRLLNRGKTSGRSDDVNIDIIRARIREYHDKTEVVLDYYQKDKKVSSIQGEGSIDVIFDNLCKAIDKVAAQ